MNKFWRMRTILIRRPLNNPSYWGFAEGWASKASDQSSSFSFSWSMIQNLNVYTWKIFRHNTKQCCKKKKTRKIRISGVLWELDAWDIEENILQSFQGIFKENQRNMSIGFWLNTTKLVINLDTSARFDDYDDGDAHIIKNKIK